jgi:predicted nucleic acid-binding protein
LKYLLDTNPIIVSINNRLILPPQDYLISIISEMELLSYSGLNDFEVNNIQSLLSHFDIIGISHDIKIKTIEIRKKYNLKLPDSIIVATAIIEKAVLVTADKQLLKIKDVTTIGI